MVYLSCVDNWQVYARPMAQAKAVYAELSGGSVPENSFPVEDEEQQSSVPETGAQQIPERQPSESEESDSQTAEGAKPSADEAAAEDGEVSRDGEVSGAEEAEESVPGEQTGDVEPVYTSVEDDYFADAVFIGDSRTVGMYEYGGLENISTFYASTGLTVYKIFDSDIVTVPGQKKKITVEEALKQNSFQKIYLMIGINEMGTGTVETFAAKYQEVVEHLLELQPDAILYIQGIIKVTSERSNQGDYITNEGIEARNEAISRLADNRRIFYLDVNPFICDETGGMVEDYTFDGVHLKAQYIEIWKEFLKSHAIQ